MAQHNLKTWPEFYHEVLMGRKKFEVRKDDRNFAVNDFLMLSEWDPTQSCYTGRSMACVVTYKLDGGQFGIEPGFCVLGIADHR